jgi:hypothetical protein
LEIYTNDIIDEVRRIKNDFTVVLSQRFFYYVEPRLSQYYGKTELFGEEVAQQFPDSQREGTACVLHLARAMETIVWSLATKLKVAINPRDTWGTILRNMDNGIKALPERTDEEKQKKEKWSESRINLYHVKQAWRDPSMHATRSYNVAEALEIIEKARSFVQHFATL